MATADELLAAAMTKSSGSIDSTNDTEILVADLNSRVIVIPATVQILGVEHDDDVKRLQFKAPRYYGEFDLSTFDIRINFENADGIGDIYPVTDVEVLEDDTISFTWLIDSIAFEVAGSVKFSISMKKYNSDGKIESALNTAIATLPVLKGLETNENVISQNPGIFDQLMFRLYAVEAASGMGRDGYYSVVKVEESETGVLFSILNQNGETIATVRHGETPTKGVDYWTDEDKLEIEQAAFDYTTLCIDRWAPAYKTATLIGGADNWPEHTQTINVDGVTTDNVVMVSPVPDTVNYETYLNNSVRCVAQGNNLLSFVCSSVPETDLAVNVAIYHNKNEFSGGMSVTDDGAGNVTIL